MVEFVLVVPIIALLFFGLVDFGRVVYAQNALVEGAREAVRAAIVPVGNATAVAYTQAQYDAIRTRALSTSKGVTVSASGVTGDPTRGCAAEATALGVAGVNDSVSASTCFYPSGVASGSKVVVNLRATIQLLTPFISNVVGGPLTITTQSIGYVQ
jgi:Flp pilus assembly protein TadG